MRGLALNDPYVPERLLAALYGVVMARSWERGAGSFTDDDLPAIVAGVFRAIFSPGASHPTTHALARDYARGIIARGLYERPDLLSDAKKALAAPPYPGMRQDEWPTIDDRDKGKYRDGNSPLGLDFANYTLGRIIRDRRNYDFESPEYLKVRGQIMWRMYILGYSLEVFGSLDQWIARAHGVGRNDPGKTDRYGKKYAWIAYFELAGVRDDLGLLRDQYGNDPRLSDVDIEPSFPHAQRVETPAFVPPLILPPGMDPLAWFKDGAAPSLRDLVVRTDILASGDEWLLIEGSLSQEEDSPRHVDVWFSSFIVDRADAAKIVEAARAGALEYDMIGMPSDYYLFAGEVPWSASYPANTGATFRIIRGKRMVQRQRTRQVLKKRGQELTDSEVVAVLDALRDDPEVEADAAESDSGGGDELADLDVSIEQTTEMVEDEVVDSENVTALPTCRGYSWESYHTTTAQDRVFTTLDRPIGGLSRLQCRPDEWELFDEGGKQVTKNLVFGDRWDNGGHLFYVRADVLNRYLSARGKTLVVLMRGQRIINGKYIDELKDVYIEGGGRTEFQDGWRFDRIASPRPVPAGLRFVLRAATQAAACC